MKQKTKLFAVLGLLLASSAFSAGKEQKIGQKGTVNYKQIGESALQQLDCDCGKLLEGWRMKFHPKHPSLLAETNNKESRIDVWVRPKYPVAAVLAHELGHVLDFRYLTQAQREEWYRVRGIPKKTPWYSPCDKCSDYTFGVGDFAECMRWTLKGPSYAFQSRLGPPTLTQQQLIRQWLAEINPAGK